MHPLYPLRFRPVYKDYLWGGRRIIEKYQRAAPPGVCAESWELADRADGMSIVDNGPLAGVTLGELIKTRAGEMLGAQSARDVFPLLIKLIDAREALSVQVHPDEEAAARYGGESKTEMWYVLDATPDATVCCGLKPGVNEQQFRSALADGNVGDLLVEIPVRHGDALFVPGGRVHSIRAGCLLFEVQQNSNTTYRLFDWNRTDPNGRPRELHIEEALRVIRWDDAEPAKVKGRRIATPGKSAHWEILKTPYFRVERFDIKEPLPLNGAGGCQFLFVVNGSVVVSSGDFAETANPGTGYLVPAAVSSCTLTPANGPAEVLRVTIPPASL